MVTRLVVVQQLCTVHPDGDDRRLVGSTLTATLPRHQIREFAAISAKFFMNEQKRTLEPGSSGEEKRALNPTNVLGPLLTCMHQGNQETCRTR